MTEKMFDYEYRPGEEIVLRFRPPRLRGLPASTKEHLMVARKETLLALRSLIDKALERVEEKEKERERTKIEVE